MLSNLNAVISTNESTEFITGHVIYNPDYTYKFQLKTTMHGELFLDNFTAFSRKLHNNFCSNRDVLGQLSQLLPKGER